MTEEQALEQATAEIEAAKPMYKQVNNDRMEFDDSDYDQAVEDRKNSILNDYNFGYIQARQEAYGSVQDQLDMQYWDGVNGTTTWADHIEQVKADNPKPE
jgi:hypothetical protein